MNNLFMRGLKKILFTFLICCITFFYDYFIFYWVSVKYDKGSEQVPGFFLFQFLF